MVLFLPVSCVLCAGGRSYDLAVASIAEQRHPVVVVVSAGPPSMKGTVPMVPG
ncbi:unannotated protein [freshwater metagenome]|uniref:Unannotated protein n=1 Tax=freshwater metagenome TaxID=449393 RepID=A0A6J7AJ80_9ZZZZ